MTFLKQNWFKLGLLVIALIFVLGFLVINYKEYLLHRFAAEKTTIEWATENAGNSFDKLIGSRELINFRNHLWNLFNERF